MKLLQSLRQIALGLQEIGETKESKRISLEANRLEKRQQKTIKEMQGDEAFERWKIKRAKVLKQMYLEVKKS